MRVGGQTLARVATLINSHPRLTEPLVVTSLQTNCSKSVHRLSTSFVRTACS